MVLLRKVPGGWKALAYRDKDEQPISVAAAATMQGAVALTEEAVPGTEAPKLGWHKSWPQAPKMDPERPDYSPI